MKYYHLCVDETLLQAEFAFFSPSLFPSSTSPLFCGQPVLRTVLFARYDTAIQMCSGSEGARKSDILTSRQFYIPLWIVIGYNVWNVSTLIFHLRGLVLSTQDDSQTNSDLQLFWRLALYPVILIVCCNRIYNSLYPDEPIFVLYFLHKFFGSMQGFFNFLVYGMSTAVRAKLYEALSWFLSLFGIKLQGASSDEMELTKYSINREEADG
eukprot:760907-Hanusia_phi.AAC.3